MQKMYKIYTAIEERQTTAKKHLICAYSERIISLHNSLHFCASSCLYGRKPIRVFLLDMDLSVLNFLIKKIFAFINCKLIVSLMIVTSSAAQMFEAEVRF